MFLFVVNIDSDVVAAIKCLLVSLQSVLSDKCSNTFFVKLLYIINVPFIDSFWYGGQPSMWSLRDLLIECVVFVSFIYIFFQLVILLSFSVLCRL